ADGAVDAPNPALLQQLAVGEGTPTPAPAGAPVPRTTQKVETPQAPKPTQAVPPQAVAPKPPTQQVAPPAPKPVQPTPPSKAPTAKLPPPPQPKAPTTKLPPAKPQEPAPDAAAVDAALNSAIKEGSVSGVFEAVQSPDPISLGISKRLPAAMSPEPDKDFAHEEELEDEELLGELTRGGDDEIDDDDIVITDGNETRALMGDSSRREAVAPEPVDDDIAAAAASALAGEDRSDAPTELPSFDVEAELQKPTQPLTPSAPARATQQQAAPAARPATQAVVPPPIPPSVSTDIESAIAKIEDRVGAAPTSGGTLDIDALINSTFGGAESSQLDSAGVDTKSFDMSKLNAPSEGSSLLEEAAKADAELAAATKIIEAPLPASASADDKKKKESTKAYERTEDLSDEDLVKAANELLVDIADELETKGEQVPQELLRKVNGTRSIKKPVTPPPQAPVPQSAPSTAKVEAPAVAAPKPAEPAKPVSPPKMPAAAKVTDKVSTRQIGAAEAKLTKRIGDAIDLADSKTMVISREQMDKIGKETVGVGEQPMYQVVLGMLGFVALLSGLGIYAWFVYYTGGY
ncbi:MAG: hypothetical protein HUU29_01420, partial [Planctomycetaceae bacterium]|nr:hypothetical protein [Planctomycetaceae bacterium]